MAIETDVLVVGAGPAGLSAAIALKRGGFKGRVVVLDKGKSPGSHVLSGCIIDPSGFKGVLTDEEVAKLPVEAYANKESFRSILSKGCSVKIPWVPPMMHSKGYPVASLTKVVGAMAKIAVAEGAELCTGYAVVELIEENGRVVGARTGEKGVDKNGAKKSNYLPSEEIRAKHVVLAEGGCGILTEKLIKAKGLQGVRPQTYAVGVKELIEIPAKEGSGGTVMHTFGYPADMCTYGGGFVYHVSDSQVMVGYAYALDYRKSEIDVHRLFRRFKATKAVQDHIAGGKSVAYGAKVIPEGGFYSVPKPYAPGVLIVGDGAGLLDSLRIKGVHIAMQSGAAAAKAIIEGGEDVGARYFEGDEARPQRPRSVLDVDAVRRDERRVRVDDVREVPVLARRRPRRWRRGGDASMHRGAGRGGGEGRSAGFADLARQAHGRVYERHDPRRGPAVPPEDQRQGEVRGVHGEVPRAVHALLPGGGVQARRRQARDRLLELPALQDVQDQVPDGQHRLDFPAGRRRSALHPHVARVGNEYCPCAGMILMVKYVYCTKETQPCQKQR